MIPSTPDFKNLPSEMRGSVRTQRGTVFGDEVLAAAILDRLLHHSFTLKIQGENYRLKQKRKTGLPGRSEKSTNPARGGARDRITRSGRRGAIRRSSA